MISDRQALTQPPARGTRPRNRRRLIIDAAAELFHQRGYSSVAMSDIAAAVAIGPSALYRHFAGKNALLASVIEDALTRLDYALKQVDRSADIAAVLAGTVLQQRTVGVLWRREAHHLSESDRKRARTIAKRIGRRLTEHLLSQRRGLTRADADMLAWCGIGIANSVSFHKVSLPEPRFTQLLTALIAISLQAHPARVKAVTDRPAATMAARSRREAILAAATTLFAEKGFNATSLDDIGSAVGMTGPSIYSYFDAKADILAAVISRGNDLLWVDLARAVETADNPVHALNRVIRSYLTFALGNPQVVEVLVSGATDLSEGKRHWVKRTQRDYIDEWVHLVREIHPGWTASEARIRVHACQMMINDVAVIRRLRDEPMVRKVLTDIAMALMCLANSPHAEADC